ncbi:DUF397 domain-containing protein [Streptomyces sp. NPDC013978]|uniref:DUF397 domain-containing protein n=1 Tax=Streptomyces sp. NPDC013978 TaxID=3364869 RepID=UPI003702D58B
MAQALNWQRSTFSGGGEGNTCLELASAPHQLHLRESDSPRVIVSTTPTPVSHLLRSIATGKLTPPPGGARRWQKSSFSGGAEGNACIELAAAADTPALQLRESEAPAIVLASSPAPIAQLVRAITCGRFTPSSP